MEPGSIEAARRQPTHALTSVDSDDLGSPFRMGGEPARTARTSSGYRPATAVNVSVYRAATCAIPRAAAASFSAMVRAHGMRGARNSGARGRSAQAMRATRPCDHARGSCADCVSAGWDSAARWSCPSGQPRAHQGRWWSPQSAYGRRGRARWWACPRARRGIPWWPGGIGRQRPA